MFDELTGLLTRNAFHEQAGKILNTEGNHNNNLAVIWFNLDNFKMFNKRFGYAKGDEILKEISRTLKTLFSRESYHANLTARFSDDNFVVLTNWSEAEMNTEMIQEYISQLREDVSLRLRAGIYFPSQYEDIRSSCDRAKLACDNIRKNHSINSCVFHEGMSRKLELQQYILDSLDTAMNKCHLHVLYQPIVRLSNGKICETEALTRWNDPEAGALSPAEFIPTLEQYREIHKLDIYILKRVCSDYRLRFEKRLPLIPVSVNLSRLDFELCNIFQEVELTVEMNNIPRRMIRLEITESINDDDTAILNLGIEKFRAMGYQVWMDDFGSGYSSLNVLKDYNFDTVKFDMKFLRGFDINSSEKAKYIISSNLSMARLMGMQALAEGVENSEQLEYLQSIGFDKAQGYYFGRPMKLDNVFALGREIEHISL